MMETIFLATAGSVIAVAAIYFLWVRKLTEGKRSQTPLEPPDSAR